MNYDFSTLNDKDLEELTLDLLNAELKLGLQSFKVGADGGVDLRYSTPENNNEVVVQVKHYLKSGFKQLKSDLKNKELPKVQSLKPKRYLIVTSLSLSPEQKDSLKTIFEPFIQTSNDIFGNEDLNSIIRKKGNKEIEKKHFKLWFSSVEVLSNILNNAVEGRSRSYLEHIRNRVPLYVLTENFDKANELLEKEKLLLISGAPGIGKTTLADVLLLEKANINYKIYIISSIRDAEEVISVDPDEKQLFYFDDFLGEVYYEILTGSQKENEIARFVTRIISEPNKYLILTTRTVILEQAINKSEKIKRAKLDVGKYEIKLSDYSKYEKAKILYNHIFFRGVGSDYIAQITDDKFYNQIINHKSYTPRLIEFFTDSHRLKGIEPSAFKNFISHNLDHPEEIWKDSINNQISYLDKCFLYNLFTFRNTSIYDVSDVRRSFDKRLRYEIESNNQQVKTNQFDESIKNLQNSFVYISLKNVDYKFENIRFVNPSISDFILGDLKTDVGEVEAILNSIVFIEQLDIFDTAKTGISLTKKQQNILLGAISSNLLESLYPWNKPIEPFYLQAIVKFCSEINYDSVFLKILENLDLEQLIRHRSELIFALLNLENAPKSILMIRENFYRIIDSLLTNMDDQRLATLIPDIFNVYDHDYIEYVDSEQGNENMTDLIFRVISKVEKEIFDSNKSLISKSHEMDDYVYEELDDVKSKLIERLNPGLIVDIPREITEEDIKDQININYQNEIASESRIESLVAYSENEGENENEKIENLFYFEQSNTEIVE